MKIFSIIAFFVFTPPLVYADTFRLSFVCPEEAEDCIKMTYVNMRAPEQLFIESKTVLSTQDVQKAFVCKVIDNYLGKESISYGVAIELFPESAKRFDAALKGRKGERLAAIIKGEIVSAPVLTTDHFEGRIQLNGNYSESVANRIVADIKSKTEQGAAANP